MKGFKLAFWRKIWRDTFYLYLLLYSKENYSFNIIHNLSFPRVHFPFFHTSPFLFSFLFLFFSYLCVYRLFSSLLLDLCLQAWLNPQRYFQVSISMFNLFFRTFTEDLARNPINNLLRNMSTLSLGTATRWNYPGCLKSPFQGIVPLCILFFQGFFKPQSNFSSSSINLNKKKAVVWNLKGALMLAATIPLSMERNLKISVGIKERYRKSEIVMKKDVSYYQSMSVNCCQI